MSDLTILPYEYTFGNNQLDIFKKYGRTAAITDFAILLGGKVSNKNYTMKGKKNERAGNWWTNTYSLLSRRVFIICENDCYSHGKIYSCDIGIRPVLTYSTIQMLVKNKKRKQKGILEVEYGEYPQEIVPEDIAKH